MGRALALNMVNPGSNPSNPYGLPNMPGVIPGFRTRSNPLNNTGAGQTKAKRKE